jgi:D-amino-acid dehydrogenase
VLSRPTVAVIGAGLIGLAAAYHLDKAGAHVTVVDRDPEGDKASFGNAGGIAVTEVAPVSSLDVWWRLPGWVLNPLGPLTVRVVHTPKLVPWLIRFARSGSPLETERISLALSAINARVYQDLLPMLESTGLASELHGHGALCVYESERGYTRDAAEWACKRARGVVAQEISGADARDLEPALGPRVCRAVMTPQWSHIGDPKRLVDGVREWLLRRGVILRRGEVRRIDPGPNCTSLVFQDGERISSDHVLVAAGAWSAWAPGLDASSDYRTSHCRCHHAHTPTN